jgi:hypothetical protein
VGLGYLFSHHHFSQPHILLSYVKRLSPSIGVRRFLFPETQIKIQ